MAANDITIPHFQEPMSGQAGILSANWYNTFRNVSKSLNGVVRDAAATAAGLVTTNGTVAGHTTSIASAQAAITQLQVAPAYAHAEYATNTTLGTAIPADDTIPQSSEGTQILSLSIAATRANSKIRVTFNGFGGVATSGPLTAALFVDAGTDAVQVSGVNPTAVNQLSPIGLEYTFTPGDTASHTLAIRVGAASGNAYMNGTGVATRRYGGAAASTLIAQEILQ